MGQAPGASTFHTSGAAYDSFMGRYSNRLGDLFADFAGVSPGTGQFALDVGCGPGALTRALVARLGPGAVSAFDPSPQFVADCTANCPGVDVRLGRAEAIPFDEARFDVALAQLVLHFVTDPATAASELRRVVRPGGSAAACVWDFDGGMQMLRLFWDAALTIDPEAPDEARVMRFGRPGEIAELFDGAGFEQVTETMLEVTVAYTGFDELWSGFLAGVGPAGSYCLSLDDEHRAALRHEFLHRIGAPTGPFELTATARSVSGRTPV
ncbi:MAG TPA: class I SAM-dependent methyltransferase [Acidimicrobiia bacterium]|nr:class I SAM-dependent methyltransferase [Acidimicrobiia bacterium]